MVQKGINFVKRLKLVININCLQHRPIRKNKKTRLQGGICGSTVVNRAQKWL